MMKSKLTSFILLLVVFSCGPYRQTKDGYEIKGKTEILFNKEDRSLNGKSIISGFVYSRDMKLFTEKAVVVIGGEKVMTDKKGFFTLEVGSGTYNISADYIGNNKESINDFTIEEGHRAIIFFELGTTAMY